MNATNSQDTFRYWGNLWLRKKSLNFSRSYFATAVNYLNNINSFIGDMPIDEISVLDIDNIIIDYAEKNPHTGKPTAKATLKDMRNIAASVFDYACDNDVIHKNPARGREIPKKAPKYSRRALTETEQKWIISMPHRMRLAALTMMLTGPRLGELIPLTWQDFDFNRVGLNINKSVEKINNRYYVKPGTKNNKSRFVEAPTELALEIEKAKKNAISKYMFCKINGEMHSPSSFRSAWKSYLCDLNCTFGGYNDGKCSKYNPHGIPMMIDKITPHMLRHTYATLLYSSGVDVLTASKLLGHSDIKTTLAIYTHLEETMEYRSIEKLNSYVTELFKL
ncbi:tyrosine-type recombinase/integrase [Caproiciproducens sp. LBM24188]